MKIISYLMFGFLLIGVVVDCNADPSFDCKKSSTETEHAICKDSYASILDSLVATQYKKLVKRRVENIVFAQRKWLDERNNCVADILCIKEQYNKRFNELSILDRKTEYQSGQTGKYKNINWYANGIHEGISYTENNSEICSGFISALNQKKLDSFYLCRIPDVSPFQKFPWVKIDIGSNKEIIKSLYKARTFAPAYNEASFERYFNQGKFNLLKLESDEINGKKVTYYSIYYNCDSNAVDDLITYDPPHSEFYRIKADGGVEEMVGISNPMELLKYKNRIFAYGFSRSHLDINFKDLDRDIEEIFLYELSDAHFLTVCRFQYSQ